MNKPIPGYCTPVKLCRIIDADTVEVEIKRKFIIRLTHPNPDNFQFNTPELSTSRGQDARAYVEKLLKPIPPWNAPKLTLFIPSYDNENWNDINTFNRVLGQIWFDDELLTDILLEEGYGELVDPIAKSKKEKIEEKSKDKPKDKPDGQ